MAHLNKNIEKQERICTTPQRMHLVESIKKSIHRSIQKINPSDYKNILKGQRIFMYLCYGGQIINSQYTRVALFMGGTIMKLAKQTVTVVVTNELSNNQVKKLMGKGKPIVSVLWLEACFQEKRKVQYQTFLFQEEANEKQPESDKEQQISVNFESLLTLFKLQIDSSEDEFIKNHKTNFLRFVDKKQKIDHKKYELIPIHEIQIKCQNVQKQRKSQIVIDKHQKKRNTSKANEIKIPTNQNEQYEREWQSQNLKLNINIDKKQKNNEHSNKQKTRLSKKIYQKYITDFNNYQSKLYQNNNNNNNEKIQNFQGKSTPSFAHASNHHDEYKLHNKLSNELYATTALNNNRKQRQEIFQTQSMKKLMNSNIRLSIIHPIISQQIQKINVQRKKNQLPLIQLLGSDIKNLIWVISYQSKIQAILALLSQPSIIVNEGFVKYMEQNPCSTVTDEMLKKYEVKCQLNCKNIEGKTVILLDSVMGVSSLEKIIKQCSASVVSSREYLLGLVKVDITITNKKQFMKNPNDIVMSQANFIDSLLVIDNK